MPNHPVRIASSKLIISCATIAAMILFVGIGGQVLGPAFGGNHLPSTTLTMAFLLNIAIILFGWRRAKDLQNALDAYEAAERLAERNASIDAATGLSNRKELLRSIRDALDSKKGGALLLIDLDHFKRINDLHGHLAGDQLLKSVAELLQQAAPQAACCARTGGDEFALLLSGEGTRKAEEVANAILSRLGTPMLVGDAEVHASVSIGLASLNRLTREGDVLRQGDVALFAAKRDGRDRFAWFDQQLHDELADRLSFEEEMRAGIRRKEFVPFFQPLIDLNTRELVGFEALARWRSPTRGFLEAEQFIDVAETCGLVGALTMSVFEQALKEATTWPPHLRVAVNISPQQFRDARLATNIIKMLTESGFAAKRLEIEITENSLLEDREQVIRTIQSLKNLGISVSLDNFGTGYASLAQVNSLPVDRIKIDRSFISTIVKSDQTAAIVGTIANLGHKLNVPITAEGVESEQIRAALSEFGCTEAQGWLFGRAVSGESVRTFLGLKQKSTAPEPPAALDEGHRFTPRIRRRN